MEYDTEKRYYVYEWYDLKTGEVIYVGKGTGNRYKDNRHNQRNAYFLAYTGKHPCKSRIVEKDLDEKTAFAEEYRITTSYKAIGQCPCNFVVSDEQGFSHLKGELNGMFGKKRTEDERRRMSETKRRLGVCKGKNNSQYRNAPSARMDKETYERWRAEQRARKDGPTNPNCHKVYAVNIETKETKEFDYILECQKFLDSIPEFHGRYETMEKLRYLIKHSSKTNAVYFGWRFAISTPKNPVSLDDAVSRPSREISHRKKYEYGYRVKGKM